MAGRKANGEGTISTVIRNGKTYYKANITVGWDSNGKQIRKSFGSYKKSVVLDKMNTAKYQAKTNSLSNSDINPFMYKIRYYTRDYDERFLSWSNITENN